MTISTHKVFAVKGQFMEDENLHKEFDTSYSASLKKLYYGRLDAVAGAVSTIWYQAKNDGMGSQLGDSLVVRKEPIYLQCAKKSKNIHYMDDINHAIRTLKKNGRLTELAMPYLFEVDEF